ncbi:Indole-3-acetic acid-induced protein ARG7 [Morella rubra]|uniref:Indole-3-acetic acid-induced protein ARG7 n=1 Tax=Morella rubra TaxID=262757 RepID=A0A6A1V5A6_9ROSI|nr:Indole-3-acetic acid-induced protein ARG7 [Morella rubra]KAB1207555.1 Indole-3-acetic acid-induced protein ARG7 [Morella rubra]
MSPGMGKSNSIRRIVRIRQMLQRWRKNARIRAAHAPPDVPAGHVAVCVGTSCKRFIVRATHLNHPIFKNLLVQAEEEYGFSNEGPLSIPCEESLFEEVLRVVSSTESGNSARFSSLEEFQRRCSVDIRSHLDLGESRPLIRPSSEKSIC